MLQTGKMDAVALGKTMKLNCPYHFQVKCFVTLKPTSSLRKMPLQVLMQKELKSAMHHCDKQGNKIHHGGRSTMFSTQGRLWLSWMHILQLAAAYESF